MLNSNITIAFYKVDLLFLRDTLGANNADLEN